MPRAVLRFACHGCCACHAWSITIARGIYHPSTACSELSVPARRGGGGAGEQGDAGAHPHPRPVLSATTRGEGAPGAHPHPRFERNRSLPRLSSFHFWKMSSVTNYDLCAICGKQGDLVMCDTCPKSYHEKCEPGLRRNGVPEGNWYVSPQCAPQIQIPWPAPLPPHAKRSASTCVAMQAMQNSCH
jgi:hypothetical protein